MPTYESKCQECGKTYIYAAKVSNYNTEAPICCEVQTKRYFSTNSAPAFTTSVTRFKAYQCPVTDQVVSTMRQKKNIEVEHDLVVKEPGMFKPRKKKKAPELPDEIKPHLQPALKELAKQS